MLLEFRVRNYRSFRDEVVLNMAAANLVAKDKRLDENNVFTVEGQPPMLTSAAVYGANASGKSNLVAAFAFMRSFVLTSQQESRASSRIGLESHRLDTGTSGAASRFEVIFVLEGRRYRYGFEASTASVNEEWLYYVPHRREAKLFVREGAVISLGEGFKEGKGIEERTRPNALFLSVAAQFNGSVAQSVLGWFTRLSVVSGLYDEELRPFTIRLLRDSPLRDGIVQLIRLLDLGISDIQIESIPATSGELAVRSLAGDIPEDIKRWFAGIPLPATAEFVTVKTQHPTYDSDGSPAGMTYCDLDRHESEGTKKLFSLAGPLVDTLKSGKVLVIDELEARLHPLITRAIIALFNSPETNPRHSQLIFTTQDASLLDRRLFRRDQIWFTEKDRRGGSTLTSLVEYKVRNDASFDRDYMAGRYGAVPSLGDLAQVFSEPSEA